MNFWSYIWRFIFNDIIIKQKDWVYFIAKHKWIPMLDNVKDLLFPKIQYTAKRRTSKHQSAHSFNFPKSLKDSSEEGK